MKGERELRPPLKNQVKGEQRVEGQDDWSDMHAERRWGREGLRRLAVECEESPPRNPQIQLSGPSIWLL